MSRARILRKLARPAKNKVWRGIPARRGHRSGLPVRVVPVNAEDKEKAETLQRVLLHRISEWWLEVAFTPGSEPGEGGE